RAELGAVDVEVVEQTLEVVFAVCPKSRPLNVAKDLLQGLVQVRVALSSRTDVDEQVVRQDEETLLLHRRLPTELGDLVGEMRVFKFGAASLPLLFVEVRR